MPKKEKNEDGNELRRDPYDVLGVNRTSTDQEIKSAYRKLALKYVFVLFYVYLIWSMLINWTGLTFVLFMFRYHPDKNANDPKASDMFKEIVYSYNILSDPEKRQQYDSAGFEVC